MEAKDTHKVVTVGDEYEVGFAEGKKAGAQEVIRWLVEKRILLRCLDLLNNQTWQAKLKEWGINPQ